MRIKLKKIAGDFNIIPEENDVYAPEKYLDDALFKIEVRKKYRTLLNLGFQDMFRKFDKKDGNYTFWDYQKNSWNKNNGLRIDHILASNNLVDMIKKIEIKKKFEAKLKLLIMSLLNVTFKKGTSSKTLN